MRISEIAKRPPAVTHLTALSTGAVGLKASTVACVTNMVTVLVDPLAVARPPIADTVINRTSGPSFFETPPVIMA